MNHILKTWPVYWERVKSGEKTFEVRKNDRDFQTGDTLQLVRFDPEGDEEAAVPGTNILMKRITYVLPGGQHGIEPGYVVLGLGETAP